MQSKIARYFSGSTSLFTGKESNSLTFATIRKQFSGMFQIY